VAPATSRRGLWVVRATAPSEPACDGVEIFVELFEREPVRNGRVDDPGSDPRIERVEVDVPVHALDTARQRGTA
jgi:hypothetical protein